jgi:dTDP-4-amino-4,6-dideoxygalactose transaminase
LQQAFGYLGHKKGDFPIAEEVANSCLSLPIWPGMNLDMVVFVATKIKNYFER